MVQGCQCWNESNILESLLTIVIIVHAIKDTKTDAVITTTDKVIVEFTLRKFVYHYIFERLH